MYYSQRSVNKKVGDNENIIDDLQYLQKQRDILTNQKQKKIGQSDTINLNKPDEMIMQNIYNTRQNNSSDGGYHKNTEDDDIEITDNYDPTKDFLNKNGLFEKNSKLRIQTTYLHVDSSQRLRQSILQTSNSITLAPSSMYFTKTVVNTLTNQTDNFLNIVLNKSQLPSSQVNTTIETNNSLQDDNSTNAPYSVGSNITITNLSLPQYTINPLYTYNVITDSSNVNQNDVLYSIIFQEGKNYAIVKTNFDTSVSYNTDSNNGLYVSTPIPTQYKNLFDSFTPYFEVGEGILYDDLKNYDTSNLYVSMTGFIGNAIGNIQSNFLNSTHRIFFVNPTNNLSNEFINLPNNNNVVTQITGFYIDLPQPFTNLGEPLTYSDYGSMSITLTFQYIGGIPLNQINSGIPISNQNVYGYQLISSLTELPQSSDVILSIKMNSNTYYYNTANNPINFGNDDVVISSVSKIIPANNNPNSYFLELPTAIHDVFNVKIVESKFPNSQNAFNINNNKLYWQNIDDGETVYNVVVPPGNYNPDILVSLLQQLMFNALRAGINPNPVNNFYRNITYDDPDINIYLATRIQNPVGFLNQGGYTDRVLFNISINSNTSITQFSSFKQATLNNPIIKIVDDNNNPPPSQAVANDPILGAYTPPFTIKILHPYHNLQVGDQITLSGFVTTLGIPDIALNTIQTITNVAGIHTYEFKLYNLNLSQIRANTYGGFGATVYVPNVFRLRFDYSDTIGTQLGFRNVGDSIAITKFNSTVSNTDSYQNEITTVGTDGNTYIYNDVGGLELLTNNVIQFSGSDYLYLVIDELGGCQNITTNQNITTFFTKINLVGLPNRILYNSFALNNIVYYNHLNLKTLTINIYDQTGKLYDFGGVDHAFTLEINYIVSLPNETMINTKFMK